MIKKTYLSRQGKGKPRWVSTTPWLYSAKGELAWHDNKEIYWLCGEGMKHYYPQINDNVKKLRLWGSNAKMHRTIEEIQGAKENHVHIARPSYSEYTKEIDWEGSSDIDETFRSPAYAEWLQTFDTDKVYVWLEIVWLHELDGDINANP